MRAILPKVVGMNKNGITMTGSEEYAFIKFMTKKSLRNNPQGVTSRQAAEQLKKHGIPVTIEKISKILNDLAFENEIYVRKLEKEYLYYPNHRSPHPTIEKPIYLHEEGQPKLMVSLVENPLGNYLILTKKIEDRNRKTSKTIGSLSLNLQDLEEILGIMLDINDIYKIKKGTNNKIR